MNSKKLLILGIIVIICVTAVCGAYIATQPKQQDTEFRVLSDESLYDGDDVIVKLITKNETPIANQSINVTVVDADGEGDTINLITNESGMAIFKLDGLDVGNYTLDCRFGGSKHYKATNDTFSQEIKKEVEETINSDTDGVYEVRRETGSDGLLRVYYSNGYYRIYSPGQINYKIMSPNGEQVGFVIL